MASGPADAYQVVTNRHLSGPASRLADALDRADPLEIDRVWPSSTAPTGAVVPGAELLKCRVVRERRSAEELLCGVRAKIRDLRVRAGVGTDEVGAGLLTVYLVGQLFRHGSGGHPHRVSKERAAQWLRIPAADVAQSVGQYAWGVPIAVPFAGGGVRTTKLAELVERIIDRPRVNPREPRVAVITGLSGRGKSVLCAQFACDYADHYDFMWWVDCESPYSIARSVDQLVHTVRALQWGPGRPSLDDVATALAKYPGRWLVIADNVDEPETLRPWLPAVGTGDVIVTTVNGTRWAGEDRIELTGFNREESRDFLVGRLPQLHAELDVLDDLADKLEHWPLALAMAASYLSNAQRDLRDTPRSYLDKLASVAVGSPLGMQRHYPRSLTAAISLVLDQVARRAAGHPLVDDVDIGVATVSALRAAAYCAESDIPVEILGFGVAGLGRGVGALSAVAVDAIVAVLRSGSLVQRTRMVADVEADSLFADRITINRITQDVIRAGTEKELRPRGVSELLVNLADATGRYFGPAIDAQRFGDALLWSKHADAVLRHVQRIGVAHIYVASLHGNLALVWSMVGRHGDTIRLLESELEMLELLAGGIPLIGRMKTLIQLAQSLLDVGRPGGDVLDRLTQAVAEVEALSSATRDRSPGQREQLSIDGPISEVFCGPCTSTRMIQGRWRCKRELTTVVGPRLGTGLRA